MLVSTILTEYFRICSLWDCHIENVPVAFLPLWPLYSDCYWHLQLKANISAMCRTIWRLPFSRLHNMLRIHIHMWVVCMCIGCICRGHPAFNQKRKGEGWGEEQGEVRGEREAGKRQLWWQLKCIKFPCCIQCNDSELSAQPFLNFQIQFQFQWPMPGADKLTCNLAGFNGNGTGSERTSLKGVQRLSKDAHELTRPLTPGRWLDPIKRVKVYDI